MELGHLGDEEHRGDHDAQGVRDELGPKRIEAASGTRGGLVRRIAPTWSTLGERTLQLEGATGKTPRILLILMHEADRERTDGRPMAQRSHAVERHALERHASEGHASEGHAFERRPGDLPAEREVDLHHRGHDEGVVMDAVTAVK